MQQSTLKKLSEVLGLSISTVSRALKDHPDISSVTKSKVKELAELMEYEPNGNAVQLRTRQSNVLGILVPVINNFFYDSFIASVEEEARQHGYSILIMQSRDSLQLETSSLHLFRKKMVMGLFASISTEIEDMAPFQKLKELDVPLVFFDRVPDLPGVLKVCMADELSAAIAAEAIIAKNKQTVLGLFGHPHLSLSRKRVTSFQDTFRKKAPSTVLDIDYPENIEESKRCALKWLGGARKYDVVFCMGDLILIGVMHAIHELGLKIPEDISVIGISNGLIPTFYNPKITYVETSGYKLGKLAFNQMLACLRGEQVEEEVFVESMLVEGGSL
jgi:LacI family transcriptional regulator